MDPRKLRRPTSGKRTPGSALRILQRGQSMVLVALLMIVFIGMLAVIFDGGYAYLQRRNAQTAADAGAMAGARELCITGDFTLATQSAFNYALTRNQALEADVVIVGGEVEVTTRIPFTTFFGSLLGRPTITSSGVAAANCFAPGSGVGVLPVAWNCDDEDGDGSCDMDIFDENGEPELAELYIIMNSRKTGDKLEDSFCLPDGTVNCDVDGDGENELLVGGNRSWLDLSGGGGGASELSDWIENGYSSGVYMHTWYAGQSGVANSVFMAVEDFVLDERVLLPVYNAVSDGAPALPFDGGPDNIVWTSGTSTTYYHVISFSIFVPTCVHATGGDKDCELYNYFRGRGDLSPDDKTIEGYFVNGSVTGLGGQGELDAGAFTVYLTR